MPAKSYLRHCPLGKYGKDGVDVATKKSVRKAYGPTGIKHGSEQRRANQFIKKRVTDSEKILLKKLADHLGISESELLAPHIATLLDRAKLLVETPTQLAATG